MFTPFILFLGLTVATAVIAHWSDNLGKKLGKKRVSLFGLRPRTTATILTVVSSWGIMLFTLVALLVAVAPLRHSLFFYDRDISSAKKQLSGTRSSLTQTQIALSGTQNQLSTLRTSLQNTNEKFAAAQKATYSAQKANSSAQKRADAAQKAADVAQKRVDAAQKRLDAARKGEASARAGESAAQGETARAERETQIAERELRLAQRLRERAKSDLQNSLSDLHSAKSQLKTTQNSLKAASKSAFAASKAAFTASKAAFDAEKKLRKTQGQIAALETQRDQLQSLASATLSNDAPIKVRQIFAERVIAANQAPGVIAAQLRAILKQGQNSFAESEDVAPTPSFPPDAKIQLLPLPGQDASGKPTLLQGERLFQSLARDIAASGQTTSIRLVAPRNYLASEKLIEAVFVAVPIAPAFTAGEVLASATIDGAQEGAQGDARIFRSLLDLTIAGRREAEKRGVNPPELFDETNFYANDTNVRIFEALRRIEDRKARVSVDMVAAKALSTVEPLQVRFEIEDGVVGAPRS